MANGYIYLQRKIQDCWIWQNEVFSRGQAWIDLLLLAEWKDRKKRIGNELITIKRGSFHLSILILADRWKWSRNRVRRFLEILEDDNMITTDRTPYGTTVTIVKYEDYQIKRTPDEPPYEPTDEPPNEPTDEPTDEPQMNKDNKTKKIINNNKAVWLPSGCHAVAECLPQDSIGKDSIGKNNNIGRFTPPTLEEVTAYCQERGNKVDPQTFIDFYSSKGWFIGKNKMKDWKASVRTWERNRGNTSKTMGKQNFDTDSDLYAN